MSELDLDALRESYRVQGFCKARLPDFDNIKEIRDLLEGNLRTLLGTNDVDLATYHQYANDDEHEDVQWAMVQYFWSNDLCMEIGQHQLDLLRGLVGPDLHIQRRPYLRMARPNRADDNIGLHRDSYYGQSPYEVACHVPFLDLDADSCLQFLPGSHIVSESAFETVSLGDAAWSKGSRKHEMGFPYEPKKLLGDLSALIPVPLEFGEVVIFPPPIVHGQDVNRGQVTRISVDFRVVNTFAPIKMRKDLTSRGYAPLAESSVASVARLYLEANASAGAIEISEVSQ